MTLALVAAGLGVIAAPTVQAIQSYNSIRPLWPMRYSDSAFTGVYLHAGVAMPVPAQRALHIQLWSRGAGQGLAYIHDCASAPSTAVADFVLDGEITGNTVVPDFTDHPCITSTFDSEIAIDVVGELDANGPGYAPLPTPQLLFDGEVQAGIQTPITPVPVDGTRLQPVFEVAVRGSDASRLPYVGLNVCNGSWYMPPTVFGGETAVVYVTSGGAQCLYQTNFGRTFATVHLIGYIDSAATAGATRLPQTQYRTDAHFAPGLTPMSPSRVLDTRRLGVDVASQAHESDRVLDLSAHTPAAAMSATFNLTVTGALDDGYVSAYPCDSPTPGTSSINFIKGHTVANLVTVALPVGNRVCLHLYGRAHVIADLAGYYEYDTGAGFASLTPTRLVDTRGNHRLAAGEVLHVRPATLVQPPSAGAVAASVNITVTNPAGDGFVTAFPCGETVPDASNVNFVGGQTVPNSAVVKLGTSGEICIFAFVATDVIVDLAGYFDPTVADGIETIVPERAIDTRDIPQKLGAKSVHALALMDLVAQLPRHRASAVLVNLTATDAEGDGFLTAFPCDVDEVPDSSNVNYTRSAPSSNSAVVSLGTPEELMCLFSWDTTHYIVDVVGYVTPYGLLDVEVLSRI